MGWHQLYELDWDRVDADRVARAAQVVGQELRAQVQVQSELEDELEVWFVVPVAVIAAREPPSFRASVLDEQLGDAESLPMLVRFALHPSGREVQMTVQAEDVSNELCDRTAAWIARRLARELGGRAPNRS